MLTFFLIKLTAKKKGICTSGRVYIASILCAGEIVIIERPYAISLRKEFFDSHCAHCCRRFEKKVNCTNSNNCEVRLWNKKSLHATHYLLSIVYFCHKYRRA